MPRRGSSSADSIAVSVNRLVEAVTGLLGSIGHAAAGAAVAPRAAGARAVGRAPEVAAQKSAKIRKAVAASWARYTPAEREARIRKMLAGRKLKRKPKAGFRG